MIGIVETVARAMRTLYEDIKVLCGRMLQTLAGAMRTGWAGWTYSSPESALRTLAGAMRTPR